MRRVIIIILFLWPTIIIAQNTIEGIVKDSTGVPILGVIISYSPTLQGAISGFTKTDEAGLFKLQYKIATDSLYLRVGHISYEEKTVIVKGGSKDVTIVLKSRTKMLPDVLITPRPIYRNRDTINYSVDSFTSKEDRVIGDIIKKLPGIEMDGDKILYQGKPIQKYYINGLDLLEGKYGLANNNLPAGAVQKVQVLENHQPIKMIDSLVLSNRASLNIQLKKVTTTGSAKLGVGVPPFYGI